MALTGAGGTTGAEVMEHSLREIFQILANAYLEENRPGGRLAAGALSLAQAGELDLAPTGSAPVPLIEKAVKQPGSLPLAQTILGCCDFFKWEHWAETDPETGVSAKLYSTELVGPGGLVHHDEVKVGLLVSDVDTDYPVSSHCGEETFFVISGKAEWIIEGRPYRVLPPGALVHHPSRVPHGCRTSDEIFLGAWRWNEVPDPGSLKVNDEFAPV